MKKSELRQIIREEIERMSSQSTDPILSLIDLTKSELAGEPQEMVDMYFDSVERDIQAGRTEQYETMSVDDMIEDYNEYINDKMTM
jgi:gas vesicle protein